MRTWRCGGHSARRRSCSPDPCLRTARWRNPGAGCSRRSRLPPHAGSNRIAPGRTRGSSQGGRSRVISETSRTVKDPGEPHGDQARPQPSPGSSRMARAPNDLGMRDPVSLPQGPLPSPGRVSAASSRCACRWCVQTVHAPEADGSPSASVRGSTTWIVVPWPGPADSAQMRPPCASTMPLERYSPSPSP